MTDVRATFADEVAELLEELDRGLLSGGEERERVDLLFRAVHTIKGSSGLLGFTDVVAFTHVVESALERVRAGAQPLTPALLDLLLRCRDHVSGLVDAALGETALTAAALETDARLRAELVPFAGVAGPRATAGAEKPSATTSAGTWLLVLEPGPELFRNGLDPSGLVAYLATLGTVRDLELLSALPDADFEPERCYLGFAARFESDAPRDAIEAAFEFVRELARVTTQPADEPPPPELVARWPAVARFASPQPTTSNAPPQGAPTTADGAERATRASLRVDAGRLDALIGIVGELSIQAAQVGQAGALRGDEGLRDLGDRLDALTARLRESALSLRMVPVGETFARFRRVVHDVARSLGKEVDFQTVGGETELDKAMVDKLVDPITHLLRNAIDHGVEPLPERIAAGKAGVATITLAARHEAGSVCIELRDDGGGLRKAKILARARERGLVAAGAVLDDAAVHALVFQPGFSTAEAVTELSGRGVGMDVVRRNVEALRGVVEVESVEGRGSLFRLRVPLTLAIIDGFRVESGGVSFVLPSAAVLACAEFSTLERPGDEGWARLGGEAVPLVPLRELFSLGAGSSRQSVVVVASGERRLGLVVDTLHGSEQAVVKPLGPFFRPLKCVAGSTVLGSGDIAFILDVHQLFDGSRQRFTS